MHFKAKFGREVNNFIRPVTSAVLLFEKGTWERPIATLVSVI